MRRALILSTLVSLALATAAQAANSVEDLRRTLAGQNYRIVHFDFNRDQLDAEARRKLDRQAAFIRRHDEIVFAVVGHTDLVGNRAYNQQLGLRRANRVVRYLMSKGVKAHQLRAMTSRGEDRPAIRTEDRERLNRRVETTVLMHIADRRNKGGNNAVASGSKVVASATPRSPSGTIATSVPSSPTPTSTPGTSTPTTSTPTTSTPTTSTPTTSTPTTSTPTTSTPTTSTPTTSPTPSAPTTSKPRPGNSAYGTGKPDAGGGNGDEPSGDPAGSVGKNKGGDEAPTGG